MFEIRLPDDASLSMRTSEAMGPWKLVQTHDRDSSKGQVIKARTAESAESKNGDFELLGHFRDLVDREDDCRERAGLVVLRATRTLVADRPRPIESA